MLQLFNLYVFVSYRSTSTGAFTSPLIAIKTKYVLTIVITSPCQCMLQKYIVMFVEFEQILQNGFNGVEEKSDVYSLGTLFYRLLTLEIPWHFDEEIKEARHSHESRRVRDLIYERVGFQKINIFIPVTNTNRISRKCPVCCFCCTLVSGSKSCIFILFWYFGKKT